MATSSGEIWRPSAIQELLLHAAMDDGDFAREAWEKWIAIVEIETLDRSSHAILPLLYRNLLRLKIEHPEVTRLGLAYRATWATNQVSQRHLEETLSEFEAQGIKTLVLKGMAMIQRFYKDSGVRAVSDFDFLVPESQANEAVALLKQLGWSNLFDALMQEQSFRTPINGSNFSKGNKKYGCDLHWHVTHLHLSARYDLPMWQDAVPIEVGKVQSLALCNEDQLIHILFNARMNEGATNLRWLTDAVVILRSEAGIDWTRFVARCRLMEFGAPVAAMLEYLRSEWKVDVPVEIINDLSNLRVSYKMKRAYEAFSTAKKERSLMQVFWYLYAQYRQANPHESFLSLGFLRFLSYRWRLEGGVKSIPTYLFLKLRDASYVRARESA